MKILVTGFEPFGGAVINPAYEAVKLLPDVIVGAEVIKIEIPTVFGRDECIFCVASSQEHGTVYERGKDPGARFLYSRNFCLQRYHVSCPLHDR